MDEFRKISWAETTLHDAAKRGDCASDTGVRLYCVASPKTYGKNAAWNLQVRAQVKNANGRPGTRFAIGTASMSREDLEWLRDQIDEALR